VGTNRLKLASGTVAWAALASGRALRLAWRAVAGRGILIGFLVGAILCVFVFLPFTPATVLVVVVAWLALVVVCCAPADWRRADDI
jgi:Mg/Co/Ni transporter MgtE